MKVNHWLWNVLWFLLVEAAFSIGQTTKSKVTYLEPGDIVKFERNVEHRSIFNADLRTYCYRGGEKTLARIFESIELHLDINDDDYVQYEGDTPDEVREHYDEKRSLFSISLFSQKRTRLQLSPFEQQCIGIETNHPYRVRLQQQRIDFWRVIQVAVSVTIFSYAGLLSHNNLFYYVSGVLIGICSSFMLVVWLCSKLVPKRTVMYGMLISGWAVGFYVIQMLWENFQLILVTYRHYVVWYILITGMISFLVCYRFGPPKNKRSKNVIKWLLQFISLILIYCASHFEEAAVAIIILTITLHYFPRTLLYKMNALIRRRFPPKRRLLTNEEYYEQGVKETSKALDDLRAYASSPECKQWRMMKKLNDPLRFAEFVDGASHLKDDEILNFENTDFYNENSDSTDNESGDEIDESVKDVPEDDDEIEYEEEEEDTQQKVYQRNRQMHYSNDLMSSTSSERNRQGHICDFSSLRYQRNTRRSPNGLYTFSSQTPYTSQCRTTQIGNRRVSQNYLNYDDSDN